MEREYKESELTEIFLEILAEAAGNEPTSHPTKIKCLDLLLKIQEESLDIKFSSRDY